MINLPAIIRLMRPKQWIKNAFVFAPLIFSGAFIDPEAICNTLYAFFLFCLASSATYIVNDWRDIEDDKQHLDKAKQRPLASGMVSIKQALFLLSALYIVLIGAYAFLPQVVMVIAAYLLMNLAYCFYLKYQPVLDIFTIATGFVLRVYAGAVALTVPVSSWMFITTLCVALFLASIKRRQELKLKGDSGRRVLKAYTVDVADHFAQISATAAIVFYSLFVTSTRPELIFTIPLVMYGFFRYWFITETLNQGESPTEALLKDWQLLGVGVLWSSFCLWAIWSNLT